MRLAKALKQRAEIVAEERKSKQYSEILRDLEDAADRGTKFINFRGEVYQANLEQLKKEGFSVSYFDSTTKISFN